MADKAISELVAADQITALDMFVLEQNGTAKKLTGQVLLNWLTAAADGHGGIQSIEKTGTSVLADTYRITLADTTTFDFVVNNGKGITGIEKTGTSGLVDTYTISFNDGDSSTFEVANGAKGDKGDNTYTHIKYASQEPTESSHSFGDVADNWIGIYTGDSEDAPTDWKQYKWFQIKGEKGDAGNPATLTSSAVEYQVSDSGTIIPSGAWSASVPVVAQGKYLWTRTTQTFNTGEPVISYSVSRMGMDGSGSVSSVAGVSPDGTGNIPLTAADIGALSDKGGVMNGSLNMNGQTLFGLNPPTEDSAAATKGYVDNAISDVSSYATKDYVNTEVRKAAPRNLLDNSDFTNSVNQRGTTAFVGADGIANGYIALDRWLFYGTDTTFTVSDDGLNAINSGAKTCGVAQRVNAGVIKPGKKYTLAAKGIVTGTVNLSYGVNATTNTESKLVETGVDKIHLFTFTANESTADGLYNIRIRSNAEPVTIKLEWFALYEGEYTEDTLPEYHSKGYGAELAECQRYYTRFGVENEVIHIGNANCAKSGEAIGIINLPVAMRIKPTVNIVSGSTDLIYGNDAYAVESIEIINMSKNVSNVKVNGPKITNVRGGHSIRLSNAIVEFSADL